jgi:iron(III) transport system ATP-binding protein
VSGGGPALRLESVSKRYGDTTAVQALSLDVGRGELLALVGPSGCGKSTVLRVAAGLERPDAGTVRVDGDVVAGPTWVPPERRRVGLVFQDHALFPHLDVAANVAFGLHGQEPRRRHERVGEVLDLVRLDALAGRYPHELSGGEQQRVALARALAPAPAVVLLDEPFSSLDEDLRARVRSDTVEVLRATGTTAVVVTHERNEALAIGDRVVVMRDGVVEQVGTPEEVYEVPASHFVASFLGDAVVLPAQQRDGVVDCELGAIPASRPDLDGTAVDVVLRPHEITMADASDGAAVVVGAEYLGATVVHTVRLPSGRTVRVQHDAARRLSVGTRVDVAPAPGLRARLLARSTAASSPAPTGGPRS